MTGTVVFSLDFELGWGHTNVRPEYVDQLRKNAGKRFSRIRELVDIFDKYDIPATWAVVGKLIEQGDDPLFHNPDLFRYLLCSDINHDIGLHSHEHLVFTDITEKEARLDIEAGIESLSGWNISPSSFIYPRGHVKYTKLLTEYGLEQYRVKSSFSKFQSFVQEIVPPVISQIHTNSVPNSVPATQYLAARRPNLLIRLNIRRSLKKAISKSGIVHFWLHPHNIYTTPNLISIVEESLSMIRSYSDQGKLICKTMADVCE